MSVSPSSVAHSSAPGTIGALLPSWHRSLAARRISPRAIATYTTSVEQLAAHLVDHGMPTDVAKLAVEHVEAFVADLCWPTDPGHRPRPACDGATR